MDYLTQIEWIRIRPRFTQSMDSLFLGDGVSWRIGEQTCEPRHHSAAGIVPDFFGPWQTTTQLKNALVACRYRLTPMQVLAGIAARPVKIRLALGMILNALCTISQLVQLFSVPMLAHSIA